MLLPLLPLGPPAITTEGAPRVVPSVGLPESSKVLATTTAPKIAPVALRDGAERWPFPITSTMPSHPSCGPKLRFPVTTRMPYPVCAQLLTDMSPFTTTVTGFVGDISGGKIPGLAGVLAAGTFTSAFCEMVCTRAFNVAGDCQLIGSGETTCTFGVVPPDPV